MARPRFKPSAEHRRTVEAMSGYGMTEEQIAILIGPRGIDPKTLRKHFRRELSRGAAQAMAKLKQTAYQMATVEKNTTMIIFLLKTRGGSRETDRIERGGPHELPVEESDTMLDRTITDELDRIAAARSPKAISGAPISDGEGEAGVQMEKLASAA
jgi:hypothetical protein